MIGLEALEALGGMLATRQGVVSPSGLVFRAEWSRKRYMFKSNRGRGDWERLYDTLGSCVVYFDPF